jgi:hypothetical protein
MEDAVRDLYGGYRLAQERVEALRAEAARDRLARSIVRPERPGRGSLRSVLGTLLIRTGRALGGDGDRLPVPTPAGTVAAQASGSAPSRRMPATRVLSGRHDRLDRLARDLDRLARELTAGEAVEL